MMILLKVPRKLKSLIRTQKHLKNRQTMSQILRTTLMMLPRGISAVDMRVVAITETKVVTKANTVITNTTIIITVTNIMITVMNSMKNGESMVVTKVNITDTTKEDITVSTDIITAVTTAAAAAADTNVRKLTKPKPKLLPLKKLKMPLTVKMLPRNGG